MNGETRRRNRGRPSKSHGQTESTGETPKGKRGRPPKQKLQGESTGHSSLTDVDEMVGREEAETGPDTETPPSKMAITTLCDETESSPFLKSSPVWTAIESMQVFQKFPQKPHFLPLIESKEFSREGLAIGHMVTFANVADKAYSLKITDPVHSFITCLEALQGLKSHGFEITAVEGRLMKMVSVIEELQKLQNKRVEVEGRISKIITENVEIEEELVTLREKMRSLQEEHEYTEAVRQKNYSEIAALRESLAEIHESIRSIPLNLE